MVARWIPCGLRLKQVAKVASAAVLGSLAMGGSACDIWWLEVLGRRDEALVIGVRVTKYDAACIQHSI